MEALDAALTALAGDGLDGPLAGIEKILAAEPEYARQRRIGTEHGMAALLRDLGDRTTDAL